MDRNIKGINGCAKDCHEVAVKGGWWHDHRGINILRLVKQWKVLEKV